VYIVAPKHPAFDSDPQAKQLYQLNATTFLKQGVDHVHLYIQIPPQRSVGEAVRILKSISSRMLFKRLPYLRRKMWSGYIWSAGYAVKSLGEAVTGKVLRKYLEEHKAKAFGPAQPELFPHEKLVRRKPRPEKV
jgi:Transposase IS200 like